MAAGIFREYAWSYFSFHADQRTKTFNFFLIAAGLLVGSGVTVMNQNVKPLLVPPLGLGLILLSSLFWLLDRRGPSPTPSATPKADTGTLNQQDATPTPRPK
jgi:hypothetical protein